MIKTAFDTNTESRRGASGPGHALAAVGWVVELVLVFNNNSVEYRSFAVGLESAADAEDAVLRYPGVMPNDPRNAKRRLTAAELAYLVLREDTIRPYGVSISP
jgi:hypothetical protein